MPVYDLGTAADGTPYFAMKRLTGLTLHQVLVAIADGDLAMIARWPRRLLLARFIEVCLAVELAHTRITPSSYYFASGAIQWVLEMRETGTTLSTVVTHRLLLGGLAMIVVRQRRAQEADHERIHLLW